jgi:transcriptional regulator with XRE-family HTH domain
MPVMTESFAERLRELRTDRLLTQRALADRAGIALSTIVNLEKAHTAPRFGTIHKLAEALDVDPHVLLKGE